MVARTTTIRVRLLRRTLTALTLAAACSRERAPGSDRASPPPPPTPAAFVEGERLFGANCASCHGRSARGTDQGPPLVDAIYKPSHHADAAFYFAAARGAVQHHWH